MKREDEEKMDLQAAAVKMTRRAQWFLINLPILVVDVVVDWVAEGEELVTSNYNKHEKKGMSVEEVELKRKTDPAAVRRMEEEKRRKGITTVLIRAASYQ